MRVVIDIECNALINPTKIWVIVCKDIDTGKYYIFRNILDDEKELKAFTEFSRVLTLVIGHNILGYDIPILENLLSGTPELQRILLQLPKVDTFILSKLVDYSRKGHSIEAYGIEFGVEKGKHHYLDFFKKWSQELEDYCVRDVDICERIYRKCLAYTRAHPAAVSLEHEFQQIVNDLSSNGFAFNVTKAQKLLAKVKEDLEKLDAEIEKAFPPRLRLVKEVHPRLTIHGTLNRSDFRWVKGGDLSEFNGGPFSRCSWQSFNPSSHRQVIEVLHSAGWLPSDRTETHKDVLQEINRSKYQRKDERQVDLTSLKSKLVELEKFGWKINETNLTTLPPNAPAPARTLAKRILLESRRRTLTEWLGLVQPDERIHGTFQGIGAWTHRMAHQKPNTANIPNDKDISTGKTKLLGKELRQLWRAEPGRLLAGVDADSIQLRIFAHLIDDKELTESIINGKKSDKTDPHSFNQRILRHAKTRNAAKHFLYALFFGGGAERLAKILDCKPEEAKEDLDRLVKRYPGFDYLKREVIPIDAKRGYFIGLDGREVPIPGNSVGERKHLAISGYLQNGESIVMKMATCRWYPKLKLKYPDQWLLVNMVHDEWQTEVPNNLEVAQDICSIQSATLREVGEELRLKCPLAGSYYNDDHQDYTIGTTWFNTH